MLTYKFRIYPTKDQQDKLWNDSIVCNQLYNCLLEDRIDEYNYNKKNNISKYIINKKYQQNILPELKDNLPGIFDNIHS